jgi:hypothetical protein
MWVINKERFHLSQKGIQWWRTTERFHQERRARKDLLMAMAIKIMFICGQSEAKPLIATALQKE